MTQKLSQQALQNKKQYNIEYNNKIVECKCGSKTSYGHLSRHMKTQKHLLFIEQIKMIN